VEGLNRAYAHVCEPDFINAAVNLKDRLVDMGFEAEEAEDNIETPGLVTGRWSGDYPRSPAGHDQTAYFPSSPR
jgi:hypothetical protein